MAIRNQYAVNAGDTSIFAFDNVTGDTADPRHDQLDLTSIFDALGGSFSDGKNDLQDRINAVTVSAGDFNGDGKSDLRIGISGAPDVQVTLYNPTSTANGATGIGAGGGNDDIAVMSASPARAGLIGTALLLSGDAAHAGDNSFAITNPQSRTAIANFDNISGDGSSHDTVNLTGVFDALGGKFSDGSNDAADRAAAITLTNGDLNGDGVANDVRVTIDGAADFQLTFTAPVETARDAFNIGEKAGASVDIVTGGTPATSIGGGTTNTTPIPIPVPTPDPTPVPTTPTTHAASPDGTTTGVGGALIYDASSNSYTINSDKHIVINGVADPFTGNVTNLLIDHGSIYQTAPDPATGGASAGWWQYTPGSGWHNWTQVDHDPRVADSSGGTGGSTGGSVADSIGGSTTDIGTGTFNGHPAAFARLNNGVNIERDQYSNLTDADLKYLKSIGVENVRLFLSPNEWAPGGGAMNPETNQNIQYAKAFMDRVVAAGMAVVITPFASDNPNFLNNPNDTTSINKYVSWMKEFSTFVTNHYSTNDVFIETKNEPVLGSGSAADGNAWWSIQGKLIDAIHSVNANLNVVATANMWDSPQFLEAQKPYAGSNIAYAVHYYQPMNFTHQGAAWVDWAANLHNVHLTQQNIGYIQSDFNTLHNWATTNGAFVTIDEFGAITSAPTADKALYLQTVTQLSQQDGFGWDVWDLNKAFSISTTQNGATTVPDNFLKALGWGPYHTAEPDWTSYLSNGTSSTPTTPTVPPVTTTPDPTSTTPTPVTTLTLNADSAHAISNKLVLQTADLAKAVTVNNFDNISGDGSSTDSINLKAIFDALGGKYATDIGARQAALHFQTMDINHDGRVDDVRLTVDGATNFHVDFIHPVETAASAFDIGVGTHSYDNIVIA